jgi:hypothetical protein
MEPNIDVLVRLFSSLRMQSVPPSSSSELKNPASRHPLCSFSQGPALQNVYLCKTCGLGNGLCAGCFVNCHSTHDVVSIGPKHQFLCACGTGNSSCVLKTHKPRPAPSQNHNFSGRFCLCDLEDNELTRQSDMHICVSCTDWFHTDCIRVYNECHNFAPRKYHQKILPLVPENTGQYFFLCEQCLRGNFYIVKEFFEFVCVKRRGDEMEEDIEKYPYHVFVRKEWAIGRAEEGVLKELSRLVEEDLKGEVERWRAREKEKEPEDIAEEVKMSHEEQIVVAQGVRRIRELLEEELVYQFRVNFRNEIQDLKRKLLEVRNRG